VPKGRIAFDSVLYSGTLIELMNGLLVSSSKSCLRFVSEVPGRTKLFSALRENLQLEANRLEASIDAMAIKPATVV
jgi:hypothetical protein